MRTVLIILAIASVLAAPIAGIAIERLLEGDGGAEVVLDGTPPASTLWSPSVYLVPLVFDRIYMEPFVPVQWQGTDGPVGTGIAYYDVQYRVWDMDTYASAADVPYFGEWHDLLVGTTSTRTRFVVEEDHAYSFRVRAADVAGNVEDWPEDDDSRTFVFAVPDAIADRLEDGKERIDDMKDRDVRNTTPRSRVLPMDPIFIPDCYFRGADRTVILYPDRDVSDLIPPVYCLIEVNWVGFDPMGKGELRFDVQYMRANLEPVLYIPERQPLVPFVPTRSDWTDWLVDTNRTSAHFSPSGSGLCSFRCRAIDPDGNIEEYPLTPDASTYVLRSYY